MTAVAEVRRAPGVASAPVGVAPIVWNNADLIDLAEELPAARVLDEIGRAGFDGCQHGRGFPTGEELRRELAVRGLRLAEWYAPLPTTPGGLDPSAPDVARGILEQLRGAGGEMLVVALDASAERDAWSGRVADGAPRWPDRAFAELGELLATLAEEASSSGIGVSFHPHTGTWIETPDEVAALVPELEAGAAGICLDVGHWLVGGGDPVAAVDALGDRITHIHAKDVDPAVLARLRSGTLPGFAQAVRERIFTELGNGILDLDGFVRALDACGYRGWLMVEQDSSWLPPVEAALVGRRVLEFARRRLPVDAGAAG